MKLPRPRISEFDRAPGRVMGLPAGGSTGKPSAPPAAINFHGDPYDVLANSIFTEVYRRSVEGFTRGKIFVGAQVGPDPNPLNPPEYADVKIVGCTQGIEEVLVYGATGLTLQSSNVGGTPLDNFDLSCPPLYTMWVDDEGFDEIVVYARAMTQGEPLPSVRGFFGEQILVNVSGKLWR